MSNQISINFLYDLNVNDELALPALDTILFGRMAFCSVEQAHIESIICNDSLCGNTNSMPSANVLCLKGTIESDL